MFGEYWAAGAMNIKSLVTDFHHTCSAGKPHIMAAASSENIGEVRCRVLSRGSPIPHHTHVRRALEVTEYTHV